MVLMNISRVHVNSPLIFLIAVGVQASLIMRQKSWFITVVREVESIDIQVVREV